MIHEFIAYLIIHKATVFVSLGIFYVMAAGTQPPLGSKPPSGYWRTWGYNLFQSGAANFANRFHPVYVDPSTTNSVNVKPSNASQPDATIVSGK